MDAIAEYLLTVTSAAVVCSFAQNIAGEKNSAGKITKIVSGIFLIVTLISPVINLQFEGIGNIFEDYRTMAAESSASGAQMANDATGNIIKEKTEAYILEEAKNMNLDITVEVTLCDSDPPVPCQVIITGIVSPYKKSALSQLISDDLGISQEYQRWI